MAIVTICVHAISKKKFFFRQKITNSTKIIVKTFLWGVFRVASAHFCVYCLNSTESQGGMKVFNQTFLYSNKYSDFNALERVDSGTSLLTIPQIIEFVM